jgi:hypothetical protein
LCVFAAEAFPLEEILAALTIASDLPSDHAQEVALALLTVINRPKVPDVLPQILDLMNLLADGYLAPRFVVPIRRDSPLVWANGGIEGGLFISLTIGRIESLVAKMERE